eukprot:TRINITY_DN45412_c0_g1_i1.p1 TRINITY_DN45412_c0_g1~~TRINITY_DN45412_c0_g1_i1.p1  ORF type:complete len:764 (+),score=208.78 TRINITY_DN45412_c0_g1_i1:69-2294(+)
MATKIIYTLTDEAPMLATYALLPIIKGFAKNCDVDVELRDISVAGRVIAHFPEKLKDDQKMSDHLSELGELAKTPAANIIKLPNISASIPQLKACIDELQRQGYDIPNYPEDPKDDAEKAIQAKYSKVLGSAVNPVLREGNSDRRSAVPIKNYAKKYPHSMGKWTKDSKTHVAHMDSGDFFANEVSACVQKSEVRIEHVGEDGAVTVLKEKVALQDGEVLDASFMSAAKLQEFFAKEIEDAKAKDVMFSLHMKATMMKVSDPIIFGHCVKAFYKDVFEKHAATFEKLGVNPNNGLGDVYKKIATLPAEQKAEIEADIEKQYETRPRLAMVNAGKKITNLHVPSDVIIDNSVPTAIRWAGQMQGPSGKDEDIKAVIPDRSYATSFKTCIEYCIENGSFDPKTMGGVPNVGLMAQKAEEYGSHDKTFELKAPGSVRIVDIASGNVVLETPGVQKGDIWRACQTKDAPIKDWVKLAVTRAKAYSPCKAVFWLDSNRAHDRVLIEKVNTYLKEHDTTGLDIEILAPVDAMKVSCKRATEGLNTISVTGNVLRDYLTDLWPILELGTSAKMLSIVPMLAGGGMYETGAGGSAPKHVEQFEQENHLRWDSSGEYLALTASIEDLYSKSGNAKAKVLAAALDKAVEKFLDANKNPGRKVKELDNRAAHYFLAMYWAEALGNQDEDAALKEKFAPIAKELEDNEKKICQDLIDCQGAPADLGGYYHPDPEKLTKLMNPSDTLNAIVAKM